MFTSKKETALVTGASSGMGKEIAKRLIKDGFQVYVAARHLEKMEDLASLGAMPLRMDISKEQEIKATVDTILGQVDSVDVLVNNAGFGLYGPIETLTYRGAAPVPASSRMSCRRPCSRRSGLRAMSPASTPAR